jgi:hypothetical protein
LREVVLKNGRYEKRTPKSREMFERAKKFEPAGISYRFRSLHCAISYSHSESDIEQLVSTIERHAKSKH